MEPSSATSGSNPSSPREGTPPPAAAAQPVTPPVATTSKVGIDIVTLFAAMWASQHHSPSSITRAEWEKVPESLRKTPLMQMTAKASGLIENMSCSYDEIDKAVSKLHSTLKQWDEQGEAQLKNFLDLIKTLASEGYPSQEQIVEGCPISHRREFLIALVNYPKGKNRFAESLDAAMKINPKAVHALGYILFNHPRFSFALDPDISTLIKEMEQKTLQPTLLCYLLCGLRHNNFKSNPQEEVLIDKLMHFVASEKPDYFKYFTTQRVSVTGAQKLFASAERLRKAGGSPYSCEYAKCIMQGITTNTDPALVAWLIAPFCKTEFSLGSLACEWHYVSATAPLIPVVVASATMEQLFSLCSLTHPFLLSQPATEQICETIFELRPDTLPEKTRLIILGKIISYLETLDEDLINRRTEILYNWIQALPQDELLQVLKLLVNLRQFPRFWTLLAAESPLVLSPRSTYVDLFRTVLYKWPQLRLPGNLTAPAPQEVVSSSLFLKLLYAWQFPNQFARPLVNSQQLVNAVHFESAEQFGEDNELSANERLSIAFAFLRAYLDDQVVLNYLRAHLDQFLDHIMSMDDDSDLTDGETLNFLTMSLQIIPKVIESETPYTEAQVAQVNAIIQETLDYFEDATTQCKNAIPLLIALAEIAQKTPQLITIEINLNLFNLISLMTVTDVEQLQITQAQNILKKYSDNKVK